MERALRGVFRNWRRYVVVALVITAVTASMTVASMEREAARGMMKEYADDVGVKVTLTPDLRKAFALGVDENGFILIPEITPEKMVEFSKSRYLKETLFTISLQAYGEELQAVGRGAQEDESYGLSFVPSNGEDVETSERANCVLIAHSDSSLMEEFNIGLRELVQGDFKEEKDTCIISEEFAKINDLQIGDVLQVCNADDAAEKISLCVTGIYLDGTALQSGGNIFAVRNRRNEILVSYGTLAGERSSSVNKEAIYYLKNPDDADAFQKEIREKGLPDIYNVNVDAENYYMVMKPATGLQGVAETMFLVVAAVGLAVLALLSVLQIQDRKYELGILRAMGMKKRSIIGLLLTEYLFICLIGLSLGILMGGMTVQPIFNMTLGQQIQVAEERKPDFSPNYGAGVSEIGNGASDNITIEAYKVHPEFTVKTLAMVIGSVMLIGVMVNGICLISWVRKEPMRLLVER